MMIEQGSGGDIVDISSKNAVFAGPNNVAYGAAKAAQLHQMRLAANDLEPLCVRVNAVNPDAVLRGPKRFGGDGGHRPSTDHGVHTEDLGRP